MIARQLAGARVAGAPVGGQFKTSEHTEPTSLIGDVGFRSNDELFAQSVLARLPFGGDIEVTDLRGSDSGVVLTYRGEELRIDDILNERFLTEEERREGITARAEHLMDMGELAHLRAAGSLSEDIAALKEAELRALAERTQDLEMYSRWAPGNLMFTPRNIVIEEVSFGDSARYVLDVDSDQVGRWQLSESNVNETLSTLLELDVPSDEQYRDELELYRTDLEHVLTAQLGAEVRVWPGTGTIDAIRSWTGTGPITKEQAEEWANGDLRSMDTAQVKGAVAEFLSHSELVAYSDVSAARDRLGSGDPITYFQHRGTDMSPGDWTAVLQASVNGDDIPTGSLLRKFLYNGLVSNRNQLATEVRELIPSLHGDAAVLAEEFASRLTKGRLSGRPEPSIFLSEI